MDELKKILRGFKVYYSKGPKDEDGDYIVSWEMFQTSLLLYFYDHLLSGGGRAFTFAHVCYMSGTRRHLLNTENNIGNGIGIHSIHFLGI